MDIKHLARAIDKMAQATQDMAAFAGSVLGTIEGVDVKALDAIAEGTDILTPIDLSAPLIDQTAPPRKRGRPRGSTNKPKPGKVKVTKAATSKAKKVVKGAKKKVVKTKAGAPKKASLEAAPASPGIQQILDALHKSQTGTLGRDAVDAMFPSTKSSGAALRHGKRLGHFVVGDDGAVSFPS